MIPTHRYTVVRTNSLSSVRELKNIFEKRQMAKGKGLPPGRDSKGKKTDSDSRGVSASLENITGMTVTGNSSDDEVEEVFQDPPQPSAAEGQQTTAVALTPQVKRLRSPPQGNTAGRVTPDPKQIRMGETRESLPVGDLAHILQNTRTIKATMETLNSFMSSQNAINSNAEAALDTVNNSMGLQLSTLTSEMVDMVVQIEELKTMVQESNMTAMDAKTVATEALELATGLNVEMQAMRENLEALTLEVRRSATKQDRQHKESTSYRDRLSEEAADIRETLKVIKDTLEEAKGEGLVDNRSSRSIYISGLTTLRDGLRMDPTTFPVNVVYTLLQYAGVRFTVNTVYIADRAAKRRQDARNAIIYCHSLQQKRMAEAALRRTLAKMKARGVTVRDAFPAEKMQEVRDLTRWAEGQRQTGNLLRHRLVNRKDRPVLQILREGQGWKDEMPPEFYMNDMDQGPQKEPEEEQEGAAGGEQSEGTDSKEQPRPYTEQEKREMEEWLREKKRWEKVSQDQREQQRDRTNSGSKRPSGAVPRQQQQQQMSIQQQTDQRIQQNLLQMSQQEFPPLQHKQQTPQPQRQQEAGKEDKKSGGQQQQQQQQQKQRSFLSLPQFLQKQQPTSGQQSRETGQQMIQPQQGPGSHNKGQGQQMPPQQGPRYSATVPQPGSYPEKPVIQASFGSSGMALVSSVLGSKILGLPGKQKGNADHSGRSDPDEDFQL